MNRNGAANPGGPDAAGGIHRVLAAEAEAVEAIRLCHIEAEGIVSEARRRAAEIAAEQDQRISAIHKEMARNTRREVEAITLEYQRRLAFEGGSNDDGSRLEAVVARLAARLTGGGPERAFVVPEGLPGDARTPADAIAATVPPGNGQGGA